LHGRESGACFIVNTVSTYIVKYKASIISVKSREQNHLACGHPKHHNTVLPE